jgi:hypothetical protein
MDKIHISGLTPRFYKGYSFVHLPKHCPKCHRELPVEAFGLDKSRPSGRASVCKECRRAQYHANRGEADVVVWAPSRPSVGKRACSSAERKRWDRLERSGVEVYWLHVDRVYRWGRWDRSWPYEQWLQAQIDDGRTVKIV